MRAGDRRRRRAARGLALALAAPVARAAPPCPGRPLDAGDRAWSAGDRGRARACWRAAAEDPDPAIRAMAEVRLLLVSGNLGIVPHGSRADAALAACPTSEPACALARADYELFLRLVGIPRRKGRAEVAARQALAALPGPATARLVWAGALPVERLAEVDRDGLGDLLLAHEGRWPAGPGTWVLGLGLAGGSDLGIGPSLSLHHPDLAWRGWRLDAGASFTTAGIGRLGASLVTRGAAPAWTAVGLDLGRVPAAPAAGGSGFTLVDTARAWSLLGLRRGPWLAWAGPAPRIDRPAGGGPVAGSAAVAGAGFEGPVRLRADAALSLDGLASGYDLLVLRSSADLRRDLGPVELAGRVASEALAWGDPPDWRRLGAGSGEVLRTLPYGRWWDDRLAYATGEVRLDLRSWLRGAVFGEVAALDGTHGGAGAGLRLLLPPRPTNTLRLDAALGDGGWVLSGGWGEAF